MKLIHSGKVRDVYDAGDDRLLMVASDRISAFDVIMAEPIPDKGRVLNAFTAFWVAEMADIAPSHLISLEDGGRAMLVRRADMIPIECIVRGYLSGSAWNGRCVTPAASSPPSRRSTGEPDPFRQGTRRLRRR